MEELQDKLSSFVGKRLSVLTGCSKFNRQNDLPGNALFWCEIVEYSAQDLVVQVLSPGRFEGQIWKQSEVLFMLDEFVLTPGFEDWCCRLAEHAQEGRYPTAGQMAEALMQLTDDTAPLLSRKQRAAANTNLYHLDDARRWELGTPIPKHLARARLRELMKDISRDLYCAGWLSGLEHDLWEAVLIGGMEYGRGEITPLQAALLCRLAHDGNGWWVWPDENSSSRFVLLPKWIEIVEHEWD